MKNLKIKNQVLKIEIQIHTYLLCTYQSFFEICHDYCGAAQGQVFDKNLLRLVRLG